VTTGNLEEQAIGRVAGIAGQLPEQMKNTVANGDVCQAVKVGLRVIVGMCSGGSSAAFGAKVGMMKKQMGQQFGNHKPDIVGKFAKANGLEENSTSSHPSMTP
jgi:hypothetical protein